MATFFQISEAPCDCDYIKPQGYLGHLIPCGAVTTRRDKAGNSQYYLTNRECTCGFLKNACRYCDKKLSLDKDNRCAKCAATIVVATATVRIPKKLKQKPKNAKLTDAEKFVKPAQKERRLALDKDI